jgi:hypothetical protein
MFKKSGKPIVELEKEIDAIVYEMGVYPAESMWLTKEEIKVVEGKK